jgi:hypothetical protein
MIKKWAANSAVPRGSVVLTEIAGLARQSQRAALAMLEVAIPSFSIIGIVALLVLSGRRTRPMHR